MKGMVLTAVKPGFPPPDPVHLNVEPFVDFVQWLLYMKAMTGVRNQVLNPKFLIPVPNTIHSMTKQTLRSTPMAQLLSMISVYVVKVSAFSDFQGAHSTKRTKKVNLTVTLI